MAEWTKVKELQFDPDAQGMRQTIAPASVPRYCRFCQKSAPAVKFRKEAHVIPEALGNHYLLSAEECDICNEHVGSPLEDELAKHLAVARAMSRIEGKHGNIKHRFGKRPGSIESDGTTNLVLTKLQEGDDSLRMKRVPDGIAFSVRIPKHRPASVAKALARIAFFLAPQTELSNLEHIRRWVRSEVNWRVTFFECHLPSTGLIKVTACLDQKSNGGSVNDYRVSLTYSTKILLLHLPRPDGTIINEDPLPVRMPNYILGWRRLSAASDAIFEGRWDTVGVGIPALVGHPLPSEEDIRVAAYYRWLNDGKPDDRTLGHWLDAEQAQAYRQVQSILGPAPPEILAKAGSSNSRGS